MRVDELIFNDNSYMSSSGYYDKFDESSPSSNSTIRRGKKAANKNRRGTGGTIIVSLYHAIKYNRSALKPFRVLPGSAPNKDLISSPGRMYIKIASKQSDQNCNNYLEDIAVKE